MNFLNARLLRRAVHHLLDVQAQQVGAIIEFFVRSKWL